MRTPSAWLALPFVLLACGDQFEPGNQLTGPRILAIRTTPVDLRPTETVRLDANVYVPAGGVAPTYAWSTCAVVGVPGDGYPCVDPPVDRGTDPTVDFTLSDDETAALTVLCGLRPDCDETITVWVRLEVDFDGKLATAVYPLAIHLTDTAERNTAPASPVLNEVVVKANGDTEIRVGVLPAASERYTEVIPGGTPRPRGEDLTLTWFVTAGSTADPRTGFVAGDGTVEDLLTNTWTLPGVPTAPRLILVLRDNRGGVSWTEPTVRLP